MISQFQNFARDSPDSVCSHLKGKNLLQNVTTANQRNTHKQFYFLLFSQTFPIMFFFSSISMNVIWPLILFLNQKHRIENKKLLVITHACSDSRSDIANQAHSTPSFNVLATGGRRLGTAVQKPKKNWN